MAAEADPPRPAICRGPGGAITYGLWLLDHSFMITGLLKATDAYTPAPRPIWGTLVMAAVSVVLPWSTWPMVPMFLCVWVRVLMSYARPRAPKEAGDAQGSAAAAPVRAGGGKGR